jgi:hypothetical protein
VWSFKRTIPVAHLEQQITFRVKHSNNFLADEIVGSCTFDLNQLSHTQPSNLWLKLDQGKEVKGSIPGKKSSAWTTVSSQAPEIHVTLRYHPKDIDSPDKNRNKQQSRLSTHSLVSSANYENSVSFLDQL